MNNTIIWVEICVNGFDYFYTITYILIFKVKYCLDYMNTFISNKILENGHGHLHKIIIFDLYVT